MLLFWQSLKNIVKQKTQVIIFIILAVLLSVLSSASWIVNERLVSGYHFMGAGTFDYDYLANFNSKKNKTLDIPTITPWYAFGADYHLITEQSNQFSIDQDKSAQTLPFLEIGRNGALQALDDNVDIKITFNTSRTEVQNITFTNKQSKAITFLNDGLYRFNFQSAVFKNSLIGQFYDQNHNINSNEQRQQIQDFMANFVCSDIAKNTIYLLIDYLNYLIQNPIPNSTVLREPPNEEELKAKLIAFVNPNPANSTTQWQQHVDFSQPEEHLQNIPDVKGIKKEVFTKGLDGSLSILVKNPQVSSILTKQLELFYSSKPVEKLNPVGYNLNIKNAVFSINDFYNENNNNNDFNELVQGTKYGPFQFMSTYYKLVSARSNFKLQFRQQFEYSDLSSSSNYKVINWEHLLAYDQLKLIEKYPGFDPSNPSHAVYAVISPQFAKANNLNLGDSFTIGENNQLFVGAIGGDTLNIYPTIYDTDTFPDPKQDAIVYVAPSVWIRNTIATPTNIEENSTMFFKYNGSDQNKDTLRLTSLIASDYHSLHQPNNKDLKLSTKEDSSIVYNRYALMGRAILIYQIFTFALFLIFLIILVFTLSILIKKIIKQETITNGILKANGYSSTKITSSYLSYALITTIIGVPFGWAIGLVIQIPLIAIFTNYFIIPNYFMVSGYPLLFAFLVIGLVSIAAIWFTAWRQLNKNPLDLINPNKNIETPKWTERIFNRVSFKRFTTKFRFNMMITSSKKIGWFFLTFFIASLSLTFSVLIPTSINKFSDEYYRNLNYKNDYNYNYVVGNIPFSRYQSYKWNGPNSSLSPTYPITNNSLFAEYLNNGSGWVKLSDITSPADIQKYSQNISDMIAFNFMAGKGASLSIGAFVETARKFPGTVNQINNLMCQVFPKIFGKPTVTPDPGQSLADQWAYCLSYSVNDIIPNNIRNMWLKDDLTIQQFNFTFGTSTYNQKNEDLYTAFNLKSSDGGNNEYNIKTYGINENNKTIILPARGALADSKKIDPTKQSVPIVINQKAALISNLKVGSNFTGTTNKKLLEFGNEVESTTNSQSNEVYQKPVSSSLWSYGDDDWNIQANIDPFTIDLTKLTIGEQKSKYGFTDENGNFQEYYNLKNFMLKIPKNIFKPGEFLTQSQSQTTGHFLPGLLDAKASKVVKEYSDYYLVRPFDTGIDEVITGIGVLNNGFPTTWYSEAMRQGLLKITDNDVKTTYHVVGIQNSYDVPRAYINQNVANNILGYPVTEDNLYGQGNSANPLQWFNGKFSKYQDQVDLTTRFNLSSQDGSYSVNNFINGQIFPASTENEFIGVKSDVIKKISIVSNNLSIIYVLLTIITAIIIIYIMTDFFVNSYLKFIAVMKALGYSNWEVNSLTLGIFTPFVILAWAVGVTVMWLIAKLGVFTFSTITQNVIPFSFPWLVLPITGGVILLIYAITYWISIQKIKNMSIQEQVNASEI
ncbi:ABC transporter permease [Spiroplasma chrysopicola]|uniref:Efflux ABC transporter, permease protein n=1 Tax=Spiroplasma chrysopicola DF-1 TaxID=1276227 RepID=R4U2F8_9MOLU|nr:ABC transporter permease [Spiroplasma chrysopicola]AGM25557.1 efflux ABC transporter, permease protein [Spiroplasma chrysopicola DF-1]